MRKKVLSILFGCLILSFDIIYSEILNYSKLESLKHGDVFSVEDFGIPFFIKDAEKGFYYQYMTEGNNGLVTASSLLFIPKNTNRKIIVLAHGTTGVDIACGMERKVPLLFHKGFINPLLKEGYTVVIPNYRGLGDSSARHIYLNADEEAKDVLDATLAAMQIQKLDINTPVGFLGLSQGGHATLRASEMSPEYFPSLNLVGSVQYSAPINLDVMMDDVLSNRISNAMQYVLLPYLVSAVVRTNSSVHYKDFFSSTATPEDSNEELYCLPSAESVSISNKLTVNPKKQALKLTIDYFKKQSLPKIQTDTPLLLIRGLKDSLVLDKWAKEYVERLCAVGNRVEEFVYNGRHASDEAVPQAVEWLGQRFDNRPHRNACMK